MIKAMLLLVLLITVVELLTGCALPPSPEGVAMARCQAGSVEGCHDMAEMESAAISKPWGFAFGGRNVGVGGPVYYYATPGWPAPIQVTGLRGY